VAVMAWGPAVLRCFSGICSGKGAAARDPPPGTTQEAQTRQVLKPVFRLDETEESPDRVTSIDELTENLGLMPAPPGASAPKAVVSTDYQLNSTRLLVLVPGVGAPSGSFDPRLGACGSASSLIRWADTNGFSSALFLGQALDSAPATVWEDVLKGSPAKFVVVVVGTDMMPAVEAALSSMHPLLYSRFRVVCTVPSRNGSHGVALSSSLEEGVKKHLKGAVMHLPSELWNSAGDARSAHQQLFEQVLTRQDKLANVEMKKYGGFQHLKENDMPGLKRLGVEERVAKLDRDRGDDELARLCKANCEDDEEPGVD